MFVFSVLIMKFKELDGICEKFDKIKLKKINKKLFKNVLVKVSAIQKFTYLLLSYLMFVFEILNIIKHY